MLFIPSCRPPSPLSISYPIPDRDRCANGNRSDIEQEVNGLYSIYRQEKMPADKVHTIMDAAREYYYTKVLGGRSQASGIAAKVREEISHFVAHSRLGSNPGCPAHHA